MASEVIELVLGYYYWYLVRTMAEKLIGRPLSLEATIDSKTVFNIITKDPKTHEFDYRLTC